MRRRTRYAAIRKGLLRMAALGSLPEWQEFFCMGAKPPCCFQDRDATSDLTEAGWRAEWRHRLEHAMVVVKRQLNQPRFLTNFVVFPSG